MVDTPECEKLSAVRPRSQAIGEFIEWLNDGGIFLAEYPRHCACFDATGVCTAGLDPGVKTCNDKCPEYEEERGYNLYPIQRSIESLLADFFEIDLNKVEKERRALLEECRKMNS